MKNVFARVLTITLLTVFVFTSCTKEHLPKPQPLPVPPVVTPPASSDGFFTIRLKTAITVGDVVYDSIPSTIRILAWDQYGGQSFKDTTLSAGTQTIQLAKNVNKYTISVQKWGVSDQVDIEKSAMVDGALYTLGGTKPAKRLQSVMQYQFINGAFVPSLRQDFSYDAQGRIKEISELTRDNNTGELMPHGKSEFLYEGNKLRVNYVTETTGVKTVWYHHAYAFDALGRTVQSEFRYITEHHVFTNQYANDRITMLMGTNATDPNGSRIELQFSGGNRVSEKTIIPNYTNSEKKLTYDFNINPFVIIKMPSLHFEYSSKNNMLTEAWEGQDANRNEYSYDEDGYVTAVVSKSRNNQGQYIMHNKMVYTY